LSVRYRLSSLCFFFFQAEDGIRDFHVTGVQTCALPISWLEPWRHARPPGAVRGRPRAARPAQPALVASRSLPRADAGRWGPSARPAPVLVQEHAHRDEDGQRVTLGRLVQLDARSVRRHCMGAVVPETDREAM